MRAWVLCCAGLAIVIISAGLCYGVWGYSNAVVYNDASVTITESDNALIAVKVDSTPVTIYQGRSCQVGTITNNTSADIELTVRGDYDYNTLLLREGGTTNLYKEISTSDHTGLRSYPGTVIAEWDRGSAEIVFEVLVNVIEPPDESLNENPPQKNKVTSTDSASFDIIIETVNNNSIGNTTAAYNSGNGEGSQAGDKIN